MSENEYIVQCPACQTRFAVESTALDGLNKPKFHCSRCDQVFDADWQSLSKAIPEPAVVNDSATLSIMRRNTTERRKIKPTQEIEAIGAFGAISPPHESLDHFGEMQDDGVTQLSLDLQGRGNAVRRAPRRTSEMDDEQRSEFVASSSLSANAFDSTLQAHAPAGSEDNTDYSANTIQIISEYQPTSIPSTNSVSRSHSAPFIAKEYRGSKAALFFAVPVALSLLLLVGAAVTLLSSKTLEQKFTNALYPTLERSAPTGVRIEDPKLTSVQLDSGEKVLLVSGTIVNGSQTLLRSSTIEVVLFDASDRPVSRTRVNVGNSLSKAVIKSLSPEIITQLQTEKKPRQNPSIATGKDKEFIIALNHGKQTIPVDDMSGFTVRVSSVVL